MSEATLGLIRWYEMPELSIGYWLMFRITYLQCFPTRKLDDRAVENAIVQRFALVSVPDSRTSLV